MPGQGIGLATSAGQYVTPDKAVTLPSALACIRRLAETTASLPLKVYRETPTERVEAQDAPQWMLLHDRPNREQSPFDFVSYIVASMNGWGGAFMQKAKSTVRTDARVTELLPLDPARCTPIVRDGELIFRVFRSGASYVELSRSDVLYVPFVLFSDPLIGMSPINVHREALGAALRQDEFAARFWANDATPGLVISAGMGSTRQQREEARESWQAQHRGASHAHKAAVLPDGFTVQSIGISPRDAQFIEGRKYAVEEVARIFSLHPSDIGAADDQPRVSMEEKNRRLLQFSIGPIMARIEQALRRDDDLFPDRDLVPCFVPDELLRADTAVRYAAALQGKQGGWLTANEIRRSEGLPPHPDGDELQVTPVGGAPNEPNEPSDANPDPGALAA